MYKGGKMKISQNAEKRLRQRGFKDDYLDLIINHGTPYQKSGNVVEYRLDKKDISRIKQSLDKCKKKAVLVDSSVSEIITGYNY
jgi:hypothetical protein